MKTTLIKTALILAAAELAVMLFLRLPGIKGVGLQVLLDPALMLLLALGPLYLLFRSEEKTRLRQELLQAKLQRIIEDLWSASLQTISREELLNQILDEILSNSPISIERKGAILLTEDGVLRMKASIGLSDELRKACSTVPSGKCLCGRVLAAGDIIFAGHVDERHDTTLPGMRDHGHYCLPIKSAGKVIGVLTLYTAPGHKRDPLEENFLRSVCAILARIIEGKRMESSLLQFQKMEALNRFAAGIAHDFNNILGTIRGYCEVVMLDTPEAAVAANLKEIADAVDSGTALTRQLNLFSRQAADSQEVFDLNTRILGMREMMSRLAGTRIVSKFYLTPGPLPVKGNPGQMEQVLMNLVSNARDAMPKGGTFRLETSRQDVCFTGSRQCFNAARVTVSDTGEGMTEDVLEKIFEPFFTTKAEGKGSGLGLSITHGIVKQHGGKIVARSAPGEGTTFDIFLPLTEASEGEETKVL